MPGTLARYFSLIKFSHTLFALPFAAIGFVMAITLTEAELQFSLLVKVLLCMIFARNAAMAFNRWADRFIDAKNPRTAQREVPSGSLKASSVLLFSMVNAFAFILTCYFINQLVFLLSFPALFIVLGYSYAKRFTPLCHFILGLGLALAPLGAWLAVTGVFDARPVYFSLAVLFWVSGFDIIYALQDESFDRTQNLWSIPRSLGIEKALWVSRILHVLSFAFLSGAYFAIDLSWLYGLGLVLFGTLLLYQHRLVRPTDLSRINLAFFTVNGLASLAFGILTVLDLWLLR